MTEPGVDAIPGLVREIYEIVRKLERICPDTKFTPDGHMVGGIGAAWAKYLYDLKLYADSTPIHDACDPAGREVQIKTTQGDAVAISSEPKFLIALQLKRDGTVEEYYNGPGSAAWALAGEIQKNGQRRLSINKLRELMSTVRPDQRIRRVR